MGSPVLTVTSADIVLTPTDTAMTAYLETGYEKDDKARNLIGYLFKQSRYEKYAASRPYSRENRRKNARASTICALATFGGMGLVFVRVFLL